MANDFYGFNPQQVGAYLGVDPKTAQWLMAIGQGGQPTYAQTQQLQAMANQHGGQYGLGATNALESVQRGLQHLAEHPQGSHYSGTFNVGDFGKDFASLGSAGLYNGQKNRFNIPFSGNEVLTFDEALANVGTGGQFRSELDKNFGSPEARMAGSAAAVLGAAGAGGFAAGSEAGASAGTGMGASRGGIEAGATSGTPYYGGVGSAFNTAPLEGGEFAAVPTSANGYGAASYGAGGTPSLLAGASGAEPGFSGMGAMLSSSAAQSAASLLGGQSPLAMPQGGSTPNVGGGGGQLTPQQIAALSAMNSQAHRGLAPSFEARMRGQSSGPGIAGDAFNQFGQP
jgi:hypothetical protein